jgi:hypothetical protein
MYLYTYMHRYIYLPIPSHNIHYKDICIHKYTYIYIYVHQSIFHFLNFIDAISNDENIIFEDNFSKKSPVDRFIDLEGIYTVHIYI